jgi:hypothetical protein
MRHSVGDAFVVLLLMASMIAPFATSHWIWNGLNTSWIYTGQLEAVEHQAVHSLHLGQVEAGVTTVHHLGQVEAGQDFSIS